MIALIHNNPAHLKCGILTIDRKFLTGIQRYAELLNEPIVSIHPALSIGEAIMDSIDTNSNDLNFEVRTIPTGISPKDYNEILKAHISGSSLVYSGDISAGRLADSLGIPYILVLECDLKTQITLTGLQVSNSARKCIRTLRRVKQYIFEDIPAMKNARALHCNGFPVHNESRFFNKNRLLYLDSRMSENFVISAHALEHRLSHRKSSPLRLLFTGRYERLKGADDCVRIAVECLRRGLNVEMHTYGQGSLRDKLLQLAAEAPIPNRIHIHDAIPYPTLVKISREFDLFICCHIQSDPSCTYLESFGAGLPIVGYANKMWSHLCDFSKCGIATPMHKPSNVVDEVERFISDFELIPAMSRRARAFALAHTFENESKLRTESINDELNKAQQS